MRGFILVKRPAFNLAKRKSVWSHRRICPLSVKTKGSCGGRLGWKADIAGLREFGFYRIVRAFFLCAVVGSVLVPTNATAAGQPASTSVCQVIRDAGKLIGKRLRVEGYIWDLDTHGFVLTGKRRHCERGLLVLLTGRVENTQTWLKAFASSPGGPKRAILVGTVGWAKARFGGRNPALTIQQVVYLSSTTPIERTSDQPNVCNGSLAAAKSDLVRMTA